MKEPEPVTEYVIKLLSAWEADGKKLKDLKTGMAPSMASQVKARTSMVTNYSGPKFARAFGMAYPEMVSRAYAAARELPAAEAPPARLRPAVAEAVAFACDHGATMAEIHPILAKYSGPAFDDEDVWGWIEIFKREGLGESRQQAREEKVVKKKGRAVATKQRRGHREAAVAARRARESVAPTPTPMVAPRKPAKGTG